MRFPGAASACPGVVSPQTNAPVSLFRSITHREDGQALVEFALVAPLLLMVLFGIISFGKAFNYWNDANHLSAEGARYAAVNRKPDPANAASLQDQIRLQGDTSELRNGGTTDVPTASQVCVDFPNGTSAIGDPVRVTMTFTYHWIPILGASAPSTTITSTAVMRLEGLPTNYVAGCA
jgi:Flp pilus assembly protein TadG